MQILPSGGPLAAEIRGVNLADPLADDAITGIQQALLDHCVLFFRDQNISEQAQVRFTNYFGKAVEHVREQPYRPVKEIFIISNVTEDGKPIGALGNDEIRFHSDLSYLSEPGTISMLYAVEIPSTGGATQWCNCSAAYEALDDDLKARVQNLRAIHRHPVESQNPPEPAVHAVVRMHPETGRESLYVSPHLTRSLVGLEESESRALLDELIEHMTQPRFVWTHSWQRRDVVMWDNRPTMHRREPFPSTQRRIMNRTQIF